ncbi:MAG: TonB-dependent receptor domain-containing protein [Prevotella sp.]|jgi:outer membrane receptor protein involved in Fe transport
MYKRFTFTALAFCLPTFLMALPVDGVVKDSKTGEPLVGSVVMLKGNAKVSTTSGLDGSFKLNGLPDKGKVTIVVEYVGYQSREVTVDLTSNTTLTIDLNEDTHQLGEVVVTGIQGRRSDVSAVATVRNASQVLNVMSQQAIQLSPDVNVASVLQRVSGVTMEHDASGEASYAVLRGMDKRYNYTLVNGVKIPSPDDKNRYLPLNLFPSDLMDRIVVSKSLTPDMEGDAAGGVVDMDMKDAPGRFQLQVNAAVGTTDYFWSGDHDYLSSDRGNTTKKSPYEEYGSEYKASMSDFATGVAHIKQRSMPLPNFIAGLSVGNRFWDNRLGVIVAGNVQNTYRGTDRIFNSASMAYGEHVMSINKLEHRYYSIHDLTMGLHAKVDLTLGNHKLEWYNMYVSRKEDGLRYTQTIATDYGYEPDEGNWTRDDEVRSNTQTQNIFTTHLKGTHHLTEHFTVDWSALYSDAQEKDPDRAYLTIKNTVEDSVITKTVPNSMERRFQHNDDQDWAGYINLTLDTPLGQEMDAIWKAGAMYRKKKRNNRYYSYEFDPEDISQELDGADFDQYENIDWTCSTPYAQASQLNYNSKEHIGAVYGMVTLSNSWGEMVAGVRAEHTNQIYTMLQHFDGMGSVGEQSYWDWLPSLSLRWKVNPKMNVRLSYYKSINRPGFYEIVPYQIMGEEYMEKGNPELRRARIHNVDLRWEWFPSNNEQVLFGVFYKYLKDPIEQTFYRDNTISLRGDTYYMPQNLGNARNYGLEIDVIKYIRHFGVKANYTYTYSRITTDKRQYIDGSANVETVKQTRPLVNQSPHTANISLLYRDTEHGWNGQLAAAYTGRKIVLVSPFKDADQWERDLFTLDLSVEKKLKNGLCFFLKANNLTNAKRERYLKNTNEYNQSFSGQKSDRTVISTYKYGRTFLLGVRFSL